MKIGWAVDQMQHGARVRRRGWHKQDMFIVLMGRLTLPSYATQGTEEKVNDRTSKHIGEDTGLDSQPYIALCVDIDRDVGIAHWQPGWLCSQADLLAEDWEIA